MPHHSATCYCTKLRGTPRRLTFKRGKKTTETDYFNSLAPSCFETKKNAVAKIQQPRRLEIVCCTERDTYSKKMVPMRILIFFLTKKSETKWPSCSRRYLKLGYCRKQTIGGIAPSDVTYHTLIDIEIAQDRMQNNCWTKWV